MNVKEELVQKAEKDRISYIDCMRKLKEQEEVNKNQNKQIARLTEQLNEFTNSQDNIVRNLKEKFDDYNREMKEKDDKIVQMKRLLNPKTPKPQNPVPSDNYWSYYNN